MLSSRISGSHLMTSGSNKRRNAFDANKNLWCNWKCGPPPFLIHLEKLEAVKKKRRNLIDWIRNRIFGRFNKNNNLYLNTLQQVILFSKGGPQTSNINITWSLFKPNTHWPHPEVLDQKFQGGGQSLCFYKTSRQLSCILQRGNHCLEDWFQMCAIKCC